MPEYCIPTIADTVNSLGGMDEGGVIPRRIDLDTREGLHQSGLFDGL